MKTFTPKITQNKEREIRCYPQLCKSCGLCIEVCPKKAIKFSKKDIGYTGNPAVEIDIEKCIACKQCEMICPDCAIIIREKRERETEREKLET